MVEVSVNGEAKQVPIGATVLQMLTHLGISPDRVAIEMNREIVRKRDWQTTAVPPNARIEIVEFVGGG